MGLFSGLSNFFSDKKTTESNQQQQSTTQNNIWGDPRLNSFLSQYATQYGNAGNFNVPQSQWTLGAAANQAGVAPGLSTTFSNFGNIAQSGLDPAMIQRYMNPEVDNVVRATQADFDVQNQRVNQNVGSSLGKAGSLWNTNAGNERAVAQEGQARVQAPIIAGLRSDAYKNATASALADISAKTGALTGQVGAANAMTGANVAGGNLGNQEFMQRFQNARTPYELMNAGVQGWTGIGGLSGMSSSGSSQGKQVETSTPSMGSILGGIAGSVMSGMPGNFFSNLGSWMIPGMPGTMNGGRVNGYEAGGRVGGLSTLDTSPTMGTIDSLHSKVKDAFRVLQGLRDEATERAKGGEVKGYDDGGGVTPLESERAAVGAGSTRVPYSERDISFRSGPGRPLVDYDGPTAGTGWFQEGIWAGRRATPFQNLGFALTQVGEKNPFKGFGEYGKTMAQNRIQEIQLQRMLEQLELERRRLGMAEQKLPYEIEQLEAQTALNEVNADKEWLREQKQLEEASKRDQAAREQLHKELGRINNGVISGAITEQQGAVMRQQANDLYQRMRTMITESATMNPPRAVPGVSLPAGTKGVTWGHDAELPE